MIKPVVSKAEGIRNYLTAVPDAKTTEVVEALKKSGIRVKPQDVYFQKTFMKKMRGESPAEKNPRARGANTDGGFTIEQISRVADLGKEVGGTGRLKQLVDALSQ